jgi:hypothetical protein
MAKRRGGDADRPDQHIDLSLVDRRDAGLRRALRHEVVNQLVVLSDLSPNIKADALEGVVLLNHKRWGTGDAYF